MKKHKKRHNDKTQYCERPSGHRKNVLCPDCRFTMKQEHSACPKCGNPNLVFAGFLARAPKKNSKKWKKFLQDVEQGKFLHPEYCR